jgi:hypothetical protein
MEAYRFLLYFQCHSTFFEQKRSFGLREYEVGNNDSNTIILGGSKMQKTTVKLSEYVKTNDFDLKSYISQLIVTPSPSK